MMKNRTRGKLSPSLGTRNSCPRATRLYTVLINHGIPMPTKILAELLHILRNHLGDEKIGLTK